MAEERIPMNRIDSLVIWILVVIGTAYLLQVFDVLPTDVSFVIVTALLALGGLLLLLVGWFLTYFGTESGRLFG